MTFQNIAYEQRSAIGWITLNRPDARNALTVAMVQEIDRVLNEVAADDRMRVLVVTGAGRAFCAGADLSGQGDEGLAADRARMAFFGLLHGLFDRIEAFSKPVIAAVNGAAVGGGLELLLACDLVIASEDAKIADGHARYGLLPGAGGSVRLPRRIGVSRAKYMMFTGEMFMARDLVSMGLVNEAVPADRLPIAALELAQRLATKSPLALARMKHLVAAGLEQPAGLALRNELVMSELHLRSLDRREGLAAFAEKRVPLFSGL
jgi:enoyl-CoA hydratase